MRGIIITLAFAFALGIPALAGMLHTPASAQAAEHSCWDLVTSANAGAMWSVCSGSAL